MSTSSFRAFVGLLAGLTAACGAPNAPSSDTPPSQATSPAPADAAVVTEHVVEATSLLGVQLLQPDLDEELAQEQEARLAEARADLEANPDDAMSHIWVGRRTAYLGRYRESIEIFTAALEQFPEEPRLYRHRGHRYITVRELDNAIADLAKAVELLRDREPEVEPDGLPNAENIPLGTTHTSAYYHLGLAHYLKGDFEAAAATYHEGLEYSENDDMDVAFMYWLVMTLQRLGRDDEANEVLAGISRDMKLIENADYQRLLLLFKGETTAEELLGADEDLSAATLGYGVGYHRMANGDEARAMETFKGVVDGDTWAAFGYIASEAELARADASVPSPRG